MANLHTVDRTSQFHETWKFYKLRALEAKRKSDLWKLYKKNAFYSQLKLLFPDSISLVITSSFQSRTRMFSDVVFSKNSKF